MSRLGGGGTLVRGLQVLLRSTPPPPTVSRVINALLTPFPDSPDEESLSESELVLVFIMLLSLELSLMAPWEEGRGGGGGYTRHATPPTRGGAHNGRFARGA